MKPSLPLFHGLAATTALGLAFTASSASAATILTFEGQANNSTIANTFGDFAAANSAGVVTSAGLLGLGTPDIDVTWNVTGTTQFYNNWDGRGSVAQLDFVAGATTLIAWTLAPTPGTGVKVQSFELDVYGGGGNARIDWAVSGSISGALGSGTWTRDGSGAGGRDLISPNVTGANGETLTLSFTRVSGLGNYLGVDNLSFDQVPEPASASLGLLGLGAAAMRRRRRVS